MDIKNCRFCHETINHILSLGNIPLVNYFPRKKELTQERKYPLDFGVCTFCGLAQLGETIPPQKIFRHYHYLSSSSLPLVEYLKNIADTCRKKFKLDKTSSVLDIGSNDGSFLLHLKPYQRRVLGVEPAINISRIARNKGIETLTEFFDKDLSAEILEKYGQFDLITCLHTLANIPNLHSFLLGMKLLLKKDGIAIIEVDSLEEMLKKSRFDSIYHEHYFYFSLSSLSKLLSQNGLVIFQAEKTNAQGGSLRVFAKHSDKMSNLEKNIEENNYQQFATNVLNFKKKIKKVFKKIKGAKVVGFGAPAKAVTLLNFCELGPQEISFIVDSTPFKQGRYMPGVHIPIYPEEYLAGKKIDYILLLAWNYKEEILKKTPKLIGKRTKVIIPFPKLTVVF